MTRQIVITTRNVPVYTSYECRVLCHGVLGRVKAGFIFWRAKLSPNDPQCLVGALEHLQEMQPPNVGREAAEKEEQPSVHSRGALGKSCSACDRAES